MFLVTLQGPLDDLPIRLFSSRTVAESFARDLVIDSELIEQTCYTLGTDGLSLDWCCLCIVEFSLCTNANCYHPVERRIVRFNE